MKTLSVISVLVLVALLAGRPARASGTEDGLPPCSTQLWQAAASTWAEAASRQLDRAPDQVELLLHLSNTYFRDMQARLADGTTNPLPVRLLELGDSSIFAVLHGLVRGFDEIVLPQHGPLLRRAVARALAVPEATAGPQYEETLRRLRLAAEDPEIFLRYVQLELSGSLGFDLRWSDLFLRLPKLVKLAPELIPMKHPTYPDRPYFWTRAQQIMLAQNVYGNSSTRPGDRILEIGYGSPSALLALTSVIPGITGVGVDTQAIPAKANEGLAKVGLELVEGNVPTDVDALAKVKAKGPYAIIYAGDALFPPNTDGKKWFDPKVDGAEYARMLHELCSDGGTVIVLNDFARPPYFTKAEAEAAGFTAVRWDVPRAMPPQVRELTRLATGFLEAPALGDLRLFVLRKGAIDTSKVRVVSQPKP